MTSSIRRSRPVACAAVLALMGTVVADGHVRSAVEFDTEQGEFPEGVAATRFGHVLTGPTSQGRLMRVPSGGNEAIEHAVVDLTDGDFLVADPPTNTIWRVTPGSAPVAIADGRRHLRSHQRVPRDQPRQRTHGIRRHRLIRRHR